ncbi:UNVERIFIED_CONTAM: hypothetical protein GTU68_035389 [Idotea baltica]|nr:hypothetical protein [Idotea baltica]
MNKEITSVITTLKGVGEVLALKLARLHISTVQDLIFHLPLRYQDRTQIIPINTLTPGHGCVIEAQVLSSYISFGKRRSLVVKIGDTSGSINLRFYHFSATQKQSLSPGVGIRCFGEVRLGSLGQEIYHPEYSILSGDNTRTLEETLTPIYPTTEGLTQKRLRQLINQALAFIKDDELIDHIPVDISRKHQLESLKESLLFLHNPPANTCLEALINGKHPARRRLIFEELLAHQLSILNKRISDQKIQAPTLRASQELIPELLPSLSFSLTNAQERAANEIGSDLSRDKPMLRLLQGDVGSGKTLVAALAALQTIESGYQVALMAPTEILAEQHYQNFTHWLTPLNLEVVLLTGKLTNKVRQKILHKIESGSPMVIGTHALFQEIVSFKNLALIIIDEQHRFGVQQRLALRQKGTHNLLHPHQLIMTATPIPRTLIMSVYANLDTSNLDELPPNRTPVKTALIADNRREEVIERIHNACKSGRQAYWVCTLIEESEELSSQAAITTSEYLSQRLHPLVVGLVHGKMKAAEKAQVIRLFKQGEIQLLVATTVIEVGVDVPNASLMIIENPERLGLAQLHQLRGRVGRGRIESHCVLLYHSPLSKVASERLNIMRQTHDAFVISEKDLELRGPGEVLGTKQTGLVQFKVADLNRDAYLLPEIQSVSLFIQKEHMKSAELLINRWISQQSEYSYV